MDESIELIDRRKRECIDLPFICTFLYPGDALNLMEKPLGWILRPKSDEERTRYLYSRRHEEHSPSELAIKVRKGERFFALDLC